MHFLQRSNVLVHLESEWLNWLALTMLFESMIIRWLEVAPVSAVAKRLNIDWDTTLRAQHPSM